MVVALPFVVMGSFGIGAALHSYGPALIGLAYAIVAGPAGLVMLGLGTVQARSSTKKLAELERDRLPEARLLR